MTSPGAPLRSPVFHCPYCGGEDLRPSEAHRAGWRCSSCERVFSVTLHEIDRTTEPGGTPR